MFLGIDGGGSSTRAVSVDAQGTVVRRAICGPSNALAVGWESARQVVKGLLNAFDPGFQGVVLGLAGSDRFWLGEKWRTFLSAELTTPFWLTGDYRIAWAALTDGGPGIVGILGTGSVFYGEVGSLRVKSGGYGWRLGDVGSGFRLGQMAVKAMLEAEDGVLPPTRLRGPVLELLGVSTREAVLECLYDPDFDFRRIVSVAGTVLRLAHEGDVAAKRIVMEEGNAILAQIRAVARRLNWENHTGPIGIAGGLAALWLKHLAPYWLADGDNPLVVVSRSAEEGAARLARRWVSEGRRPENK